MTEATAGRCILVVDDNPAVTAALGRLLAAEGYRTMIAHDAAQAMSCAHGPGGPVAAAVVDIHLPDGSGIELSKHLREHLGPALPIIVISGDTSMSNLRSLTAAGATYFVSKPFRADLLLDRLRQWMAAGEDGETGRWEDAETRRRGDAEIEREGGTLPGPPGPPGPS